MVRKHETADGFLKACQSLLEEKEAANNLILGLAAALKKEIYYYSKAHPLLLTIHAEAKCVGTCLQTPPNNLILYVDQSYAEDSIKEICEYLVENRIKIPGIIGPRDTANKFVEKWSSMESFVLGNQIDQMVYKIEQVKLLPKTRGRLRPAIESDFELLVDWMGMFYADTLGPVSKKEASELAHRKIKEGSIFIWETDRPVSMAGWTRPTRNGVTIASVYTPEEYRNHGYATSCVAKLTEELLTKYRFCSLFTDQSNPKSNSIYQKIGYEVVDYVLYIKFLDE